MKALSSSFVSSLRPKRAYYSHRVRFVHPDKRNDFSASGDEQAFSYGSSATSTPRNRRPGVRASTRCYYRASVEPPQTGRRC